MLRTPAPIARCGGGVGRGPGVPTAVSCAGRPNSTRPPPRWGSRGLSPEHGERAKISESGKAIRPASRVPGNGRGEWLVGSDSFVSRIKSGHVYSWAMGVVRTVILADFAAGEQGLFEQLVEVECLFGRGLTLLEGMGTAGTLRNPTNVMLRGREEGIAERQAKRQERTEVFLGLFSHCGASRKPDLR